MVSRPSAKRGSGAFDSNDPGSAGVRGGRGIPAGPSGPAAARVRRDAAAPRPAGDLAKAPCHSRLLRDRLSLGRRLGALAHGRSPRARAGGARYRRGGRRRRPAGDRWLLTLRLRRPHGLVNPYGFDYEAWLLERGVGATGYVRARGEQRKLGRRSTPLDWIERAREAVRDRFLAALGPTPAAGILAALAVGDQRAISTEEWQLFNRTGVTHLMSISGLHVTLVS